MALAAAYAPCEEFSLEAPGGAALPPPPLPSEPLPPRSVPAGDVVEFTLSAKDSFEAFMGRRYDPSQLAWGLGDGAALHTQDAVAPSHGAFERLAAHLSARMASGHAPSGSGSSSSGSGSGGAARLLSPLDRFARLLSGLQALQAELGDAAAGGGGSSSRGSGGSSSGGGGNMQRVLSEATAGAQERLLALQPAAAAAAARGALGGGGPVAHAAAPDASVFRALARDAAALAEAQAQAEAAQARVQALTAALHERLRSLERSAGAGAPQ
jgi:hypothetical protein